MKEFCNIVQVYLKNQVERIENGAVIPKQGEKPITVHAADVDFTPAVTDSKASLLTTFSESLYIDKPEPAAANVLKIKRSAILQLTDSEGYAHIIGSIDYPAQVYITQNLNTDILKIEQKQPAHI